MRGAPCPARPARGPSGAAARTAAAEAATNGGRRRELWGGLQRHRSHTLHSSEPPRCRQRLRHRGTVLRLLPHPSSDSSFPAAAPVSQSGAGSAALPAPCRTGGLGQPRCPLQLLQHCTVLDQDTLGTRGGRHKDTTLNIGVLQELSTLETGKILPFRLRNNYK